MKNDARFLKVTQEFMVRLVLIHNLYKDFNFTLDTRLMIPPGGTYH